MILEAAFFKIPEVLSTLAHDAKRGAIYEDTVRGIYYTAILQELNLRNIKHPASKAILNRAYPIGQTGTTPLTCDVFADFSADYLTPHFNGPEWGLGIRNYVEIKYYAGDPGAGVQAREALLRDLFKVSLLVADAQDKGYVLVAFHGSASPEAFLSAVQGRAGAWVRPLLKRSNSIAIDLTQETEMIRKRFGVDSNFSPKLNLTPIYHHWEKKGKTAFLGILIRVDSFELKSQIGNLQRGMLASDLRKRYAQMLKLIA
jgi:hypothetical protein